MSRYKNPPKEVCMVMTPLGTWVQCDNTKVLADLKRYGFKVAFYDLRPETETETKAERPRKTRKKTIVGVSAASTILKETPVEPQDEQSPADTPLLQDNAPSEAVETNSPMPEAKPERKPRKTKVKTEFKFHCKKCGENFDEPKELPNQAYVCPKCNSLQIEPI